MQAMDNNMNMPLIKNQIRAIQVDLETLKSKVEDGTQENDLLKAIVSKQAQVIQRLEAKCDDIVKKNMRNNILIYSVKETKYEDCMEKAHRALHQLGVPQGVRTIERAHRTGGKRRDGTPRPLVVRLTRQDHVDLILANVRQQQGGKARKHDLKVAPQVPDSEMEEISKLQSYANTFHQLDPKARITIRDKDIVVNGDVFKDTVETPTTEEVLDFSPEERKRAEGLKILQSSEINCNGSTFQMFAIKTTTPGQARFAYKCMARSPKAARATHLIMAYQFSNRRYGYRSDRDWNLGRFCNIMINEHLLTDVSVFVTRAYGGIHIYGERYSIIAQLMSELSPFLRADVTTYSPPAMQQALKRHRMTGTMDDMQPATVSNKQAAVAAIAATSSMGDQQPEKSDLIDSTTGNVWEKFQNKRAQKKNDNADFTLPKTSSTNTDTPNAEPLVQQPAKQQQDVAQGSGNDNAQTDQGPSQDPADKATEDSSNTPMDTQNPADKQTVSV
jgi:hypothetical protein